MKYSREQLIEMVSGQMPEKRWMHTLGVMQTAVELAEKYGADPVKADLAAILHDVAKYWPVEQMRAVIEESSESNKELLQHDKQLWHSEAGFIIARKDYGVEDAEVLNAIRWHTSGREDMSLLDKVVCLADYIEPGRDFPNVNKIRELAQHSLEEALVAGFDSTISLLLTQRKVIYPLTVLSRNYLVQQLKIQSHGGL
jgi:predicted HD superfamily hydrolase involved in NAD metabolism